MKTFPSLDRLIACLSKLPGIGRRSAERIALKLVVQRDGLLRELIAALQEAGDRLGACSVCGAITPSAENPCSLCKDTARDGSVLCVVEDPVDLLLIEAAGAFRGRYHVLMGKISPMQGEGIAHLRLEALRRRIETERIQEVILALNSDVESEATASFLRDQLAARNVRITRPAMGLPVGSGIAYTDTVTLARAMKHRQQCLPQE
ncbi:MAG: recombination mediator RecR [Verrucomicrobia bacterium]|nr:recombination mediator RecR [Verrucomicrobiota bacterium]MCG2681108.1 recombination mediator RecR [Kiritimatiellia bacterium]MBU4248217.1 recombination mediator RecR [Verrucomicrobiota bacterium]MBU4292331.1 recombination mediator RecR [Verrucomicrobiota bacterium]MBU4428618.1 recombination mediator RecR [Verrucomicrobiota bacterium]